MCSTIIAFILQELSIISVMSGLLAGALLILVTLYNGRTQLKMAMLLFCS